MMFTPSRKVLASIGLGLAPLVVGLAIGGLRIRATAGAGRPAEPSPAASRPSGPRSTSSPEVNRVAEGLRCDCRGPIEEFWRVRMMALADLARLGPPAASAVAELLEDGEPGVRAVACEALGMLGDGSVSGVLEQAVASDADSQVRLYAGRSLGQLGTLRPSPAILKARDHDDVMDVRTHLEMALSARPGKENGEIRAALAAFNADQLDLAKVGELAPDFRLRGLDGEYRSLGDFRGKREVILVFLVGDICPYCPGQVAQLRAQKARIEALGATLLLVEAHELFRLKTIAGKGRPRAEDIPLLADPSQTVSASYGVAMHARAHTEWSNRPASFVIDRAGVLRFAHLDPPDRRIDPEDLIQVVRLVNSLDALAQRPSDIPVGWPARGVTGF